MLAVLRSSVLFALAALPFVASAQQQAESPASRAAIQAVVQDEQDAWNRGDAAAFSAPFAADGSFTNIVGMQTYGRVPFERQHSLIFNTIYKGSHCELAMSKLRFVRPDVAIADVDAVLTQIKSTPPNTPLFPDGSMHTRLQLVLSKENGAWQIDAFHNVVVNPQASGPPK